jgi:hypothetical protein
MLLFNIGSEMASSSVTDDIDGALHVPTTSIKTENDAASGPSTSSNVTMTIGIV